jgi:quercetin dioxygenase-like cupin family protein
MAGQKSWRAWRDDSRTVRSEPMRVRISPGGAAPRFAHAGEEFFDLLKGRLTVSVGREKQTLGPGSSGHHLSTINHDGRNQRKAEVVGMPPLF